MTKTKKPVVFKFNGRRLSLTLGKLDSNDEGCGWRNGTVTLSDGRSFSVGGGWILTAESAKHQNNCYGLQPDEHPEMYWPGAVSEGDFDAYEGYDNGDVDQLAEAIGLNVDRDTTDGEDNWHALIEAIRDASKKAAAA